MRFWRLSNANSRNRHTTGSPQVGMNQFGLVGDTRDTEGIQEVDIQEINTTNGDHLRAAHLFQTSQLCILLHNLARWILSRAV